MLDRFREWLSDNLRYILLGLAVLLIIIIGVCVVRLVGSSGKKSGSSSGSAVNVTAEAETGTVTVQEDGSQEESTEGQAAAAAPAVSSASTLVRDDAAVLELIEKYYTAMAEKDTATLQKIVDPWNADVESRILSNDVIESYEDISTYSKKGPVDGSFVVYAYYKGKIANINTLVPSLSMLYVVTNENGDLVVSDRNASTEVTSYIAQVSSDDDVQALIRDVNQQCSEARASDPDLDAFMKTLESGSEPSTESDGGDSADGNADSASSTGNEGASAMVNAATGVNVRSQASADSNLIASLWQGAQVTVIESTSDGWSHISYIDSNGQSRDGYVKTEYLTIG